MKCSYCNEKGHSIRTCIKDNHFINLLDAPTEPKFFSMPYLKIKRLASLIHVKTTLPKIQLCCILSKEWQKRHCRVSAETTCPICYESFEERGVCTTKCKHQFCTQCFITHCRRKNDCPLCRAVLLEPQFQHIDPNNDEQSTDEDIEMIAEFLEFMRSSYNIHIHPGLLNNNNNITIHR